MTNHISPPDLAPKKDAKKAEEVAVQSVPEGAPAPDEDTRVSPSGTYIQFSQDPEDRLQGSHRVIYAHEWRSVGVKDQGDVTWGPLNGHRVPVESLSKSAVERILREPGFAKVTVKE